MTDFYGIPIRTSPYAPPGDILIFRSEDVPLRPPPLVSFPDSTFFEERLRFRMTFGQPSLPKYVPYLTLTETPLTPHQRFRAGIAYLLAHPLRWPE